MTALPLIRVACGVLIDARGAVLTAQRPAGGIAAGKWEFPGGKIETGETTPQALARELHEELGVVVRGARPLLRFRHDYSDRRVLLDTWLVEAWDGAVQSREGQAFAWLPPEQLAMLDSLPTVAPIVRALRLPAHYAFTPPAADEAFLLARIAALPPRALLRLRQPGLGDHAYATLAEALLPFCRAAGITLMLDRAPALSRALDCGWHASAVVLAGLEERPLPLPPSLYVAASVHDAAQLAQAQRIDAVCAVLGPVRPTPTHPGVPGIGWAQFAAIRADAALPVYAIGGVGPSHLELARAHGAQGVAGISAYWACVRADSKPSSLPPGTLRRHNS